MKKIQIRLLAILFSFYGFSQTNPCESVINDTFDGSAALPSEWTEYNTTGSVTVADGKLKFEHNITMPSAYRTLTPVTSNSSFSFDVNTSRNSVNCQIHVVSSTGKYLTSISVGKGTSSIKIATTLENGVPAGFTEGIPEVTLFKNTDYSISAQIDFTTKKVKLYNKGELVYEDAPFLEAAEDIAKIDIQLIYMYANNGQFYFDNIAIITADENRILLQNNVSVAETLLSSVSIGEKYRQYPQSAVDAFQTAVNKAKVVLTNCTATSAVIDQALIDLQSAKDTFETSQVNDPVLKIYSGYDFSGTEHQIYCGFYNGTLGEYDDSATSFTLDKGYMVTFAENVNGTGVSKVYVASEENLSINLPANLQNKISFIRVSPWNNIHKKGLAGGGNDVVVALNSSWYYNWGNGGQAIGDIEFVPNQWGGSNLQTCIDLGNRMDITHHMAFNEPDNEDQSNMTVDKAIEKYTNLLASGLRLGSPANTDGTKGATWRNEFMTKAEENNLRIDYIVVHYYKRSTPTAFYNWLKAIHDKWQRPIWIKEFNYGAPWVSNKPENIQVSSDGLKSYLNMLDDTSFIERYSVFTWQPENSELFTFFNVRTPIDLNVSGEMYRDHNSPIAYLQEVYEQGDGAGDDDNDGVLNAVDTCPKTPNDETVNENGCAESQFDDDNDGVLNGTDTCSNTPIGETVNENGCSESQLDDDNDGVSNAVDICPNTPSGETINAKGCTESQYDGLNLALSGIASQSSTDSQFNKPASLVNDGNTSGSYADGSVMITDNEENPWWQVDLKAEYPIGIINVFNRTDSCCIERMSNYTVFVMDANGNITFSKTYDTYPDPSITIDAGGVQGQVVKVQLNATNQFALAEVEVYAADAEWVALSVDQNSISSLISVYPTIVTRKILNIKYAEELAKTNLEFTFYNTMGQQVKKVYGLKTVINVSELANGLYVIKIKSDLETSTKRIIIQ